MLIGGDPDDLRREARRLREAAARMECALAEARSVARVSWHSTAAEAFRTVLEETADGVRLGIDATDGVAALVDGVADLLEERQRLLAAAAGAVSRG